MPPPPPPLYTGTSISVFELDGLIGIRPRPGHAFTSPAGTSVLYLPFATMVSLTVDPIDGDSAALEFHGDFRRTAAVSRTRLAPIAAGDGEPVAEFLRARHGLPRTPNVRTPAELRALEDAEYVTVVATYRPGHFETANFEGLMLEHEDRKTLAPGDRVEATGFYYPGHSGDYPRRVGYGGPRLHALVMRRL
ncbi:MAG TPA: hypothetical protein VGB85_12070 [Nannocystis sp.]|jgi:hypothetical protein